MLDDFVSKIKNILKPILSRQAHAQFDWNTLPADEISTSTSVLSDADVVVPGLVGALNASRIITTLGKIRAFYKYLTYYQKFVNGPLTFVDRYVGRIQYYYDKVGGQYIVRYGQALENVRQYTTLPGYVPHIFAYGGHILSSERACSLKWSIWVTVYPYGFPVGVPCQVVVISLLEAEQYQSARPCLQIRTHVGSGCAQILSAHVGLTLIAGPITVR